MFRKISCYRKIANDVNDKFVFDNINDIYLKILSLVESESFKGRYCCALCKNDFLDLYNSPYISKEIYKKLKPMLKKNKVRIKRYFDYEWNYYVTW